MYKRLDWICQKCRDKNWLIECECGCGTIIFRRDRFGSGRRFVSGHQIRVRKVSGEDSPTWKGGWVKIHEYWHVKIPDYNGQRHRYVPLHRLIMENYFSIMFDEQVYIPKGYDVDHISEDKSDNSLINLQVLEHGEHTVKSNRVDMTDRFCIDCGIKHIENNVRWAKSDLCHRCYMKRYSKKRRGN